MAFDAQVAFGSLLTDKEDFDAISTSELYEANFANYVLDDKQLAAHFAMKGAVRLRTYDEIVQYMNRTGWGVGLSIKLVRQLQRSEPRRLTACADRELQLSHGGRVRGRQLWAPN